MFIFVSLMLYLQANLAYANNNKLLGLKVMTENDQKKLLSIHNHYRNQVASGNVPGQPIAADMTEMTWDDPTASQASNWASQCKCGHNITVDSNYNLMGQNLGLKINTEQQDVDTAFDEAIEFLIKQWFDEVENYIFGDQVSFSNGHYTQLVWANSTKLGCGFAYCVDEDMQLFCLVCNYSPAGNYLGENPYEIGAPNCKNYDMVSSDQYSNLCVKK